MSGEEQLGRLLMRASDQPPMPTALIGRVERGIRRRRQWRQSAAAGLVLVAVGASLYVQMRHTPARSTTLPNPSSEPRVVMTPARVEIGGGYLAEHLETTNPNVTIVRVHERFVDPSPEPTSLAPDAFDGDTAES